MEESKETEGPKPVPLRLSQSILDRLDAIVRARAGTGHNRSDVINEALTYGLDKIERKAKRAQNKTTDS